MNKFYITTPIYYVNSKPHLGTLYSTLLADVLTRWEKLLGKKVFFLTGTDEHGQKIQQKAEELKKDPKEFVDSIAPAFKDMWNLYEIEYSKFIRTTDTEHKNAVNFWINKLMEQDDIYKSIYIGLYCIQCETFVTKETTEENHQQKCPTCNRELEQLSEENYFFALSEYQDKLLEFYENNPDFITPKERLNEVISFVKAGLTDISISRTGVSWGIPFPEDQKQTVYVWADALLNYISALGYGSSDKNQIENLNFWWPADVQVMAKDILRFHAVFWPAFLMAANLPSPKKLLVHGYILMGQEKMSKSRGNIIDPQELAKIYGVEPVRYYLMRQISVNQDGQFDVDDLEQRINSDLANTLGNLLNRVVLLALNNGFSEIPKIKTWEDYSIALRARAEEAFRLFWDDMNHYQIHIAISNLWRFISEVNAYFNDQQPWRVKEDKDKFIDIISATLHCLYSIAILAWPIMPKKMEELLFIIGHKIEIEKDYAEELRKNIWDKSFSLIKPQNPLFIKYESKKEEKGL